MASLSAHLRRPDDHARLSFHPECPVCRRERIAGALPTGVIIGRRSQALVTASVLALSWATPTIVVAAEPDHEQEGVMAPEQGTTDDGESAPDPPYPGGQPTELSLDAGPAPETDDAADPTAEEAPLEQEPLTSGDLPADEARERTDTDRAEDEAMPSASDPVPAPASSEIAAPEPPSVQVPSAAAGQVPTATHHEPQPDGGRASNRAPKHGSAPESRRRSPAVVPVQRSRATAALPFQATVTAAASASPTSQAGESDAAASARRHEAHRGDRFHVVQRGESLWSIAKDLLGRDASVAAVAREVNRLWELNKTRVGTGDPDLLMAGTRLALR